MKTNWTTWFWSLFGAGVGSLFGLIVASQTYSPLGLGLGVGAAIGFVAVLVFLEMDDENRADMGLER